MTQNVVMTTTSERKALEAEKGYQDGVQPVWGFGQDSNRYVSESLEPNPDLRGLEAVRTWDEMSRTDDQVGSALRALRTPITSAEWSLTNTDDVDPKVVEFVRTNIGLPKAGESRGRRNRQGIVFSEHLSDAFKAAIFGYSVFEQVYKYNPTDGRLWLRKLGPRSQTTIEEITVGPDGGLAGIRQAPPALSSRRGGIPQPVKIPVEHLVFYCVGKDGADWHGTSVLRQAYRPWFFKDRLERLAAQIVERNGMGVPIGYAGNNTDRDALDTALSNLRAGASSSVIAPEGTKIELTGVTGSTVDALPYINHFNQQISKALAQGFQDLGHDSGARSLGETFLEVALRASQEVADLIADVFTEHVIRDLVELNFGEGAPYPTLSPGDIVTGRNLDDKVLVDLATAGLLTPDEPLEAYLRKKKGLPEADPETARHSGGGDEADDINKRADAATSFFRGGFTPEASLKAAGLGPMEHTGLLPITIKPREEITENNVVGLSEADRQTRLLEAIKELREPRGH